MDLPRASGFAVPQHLFDSDAISAHYLAGRSTTLVLTFGGVGRDPLLPPEVEFIGSASNHGENHVLAINDLRRTWYSQPQVIADIERAVDLTMQKVKPRRVVTVGNSMGGYGAILFAAKFGFNATLAIAPQFSMNDFVVPERRWSEYRENFGAMLAESIGAALMNSSATTLMLHGVMGRDIRHIELFTMRPRLHHGLVGGESHGVGIVMKARGVLAPVIERLIADDVEGAKQLLSSFKVYWRDQTARDEAEYIRAMRKEGSALRAQIREIRLQRRAMQQDG